MLFIRHLNIFRHLSFTSSTMSALYSYNLKTYPRALQWPGGKWLGLFPFKIFSDTLLENVRHNHKKTEADLPVQRSQRRIHTRNALTWKQNSYRRSIWGTCTCGCRTSGRGLRAGAAGSGTVRMRSHWTRLPASPPGHWYQPRCGQLQQEVYWPCQYSVGLGNPTT